MAENQTSCNASVFGAPTKGANARRSIGKITTKDDRSNERSEKTVEKNTTTSRVAQSEKNVTPPMARSTLLIPMAPVKQRKQFDKEVLKPKKLIYSDRENERIAEEGSGGSKQKERTRNGGKCTGFERSSKKRTDRGKSDSCDASAKARGTDRYDEIGFDVGSVKIGARGRRRDDLVGRDGRKLIKKSSTNDRGQSLNVDKENAETLVEGNDEEAKKQSQLKGNGGKERTFRRDYFLRSNSKTFLSHLMNQDDLSIAPSEQSKQSANVREFEPYDVPLSQPTENMDWLDRLRWLQPRRDVGLWIQCCRSKCAKWRYAEEYRDPLDVPEKWFCHMNSDKSLASCDAPERQLTFSQNDDLIENAYNAGSIVWARVDGFPWWPAMVDDCPDTATYYWLINNSCIPTMYHVIFFEERITHKWLKCKDIKPFVRNKKDSLVKKFIYHGTDYRKQLDMACEQARTAVTLSILKRLKKFSFLSRYTSLFNDDVHNRDDDNNNNNNNNNNNDNGTVATKLLCTKLEERTSVSSKESNIVRTNYKGSQQMDDTCSIHSSILYDSSYTSYHQALPTIDKITDRRLLNESKKETSVDDIRQLPDDIFIGKMQCSQSRSISGTSKLTSLTKCTIRENNSADNVGKKSDDRSMQPTPEERSQVEILSEDEIPSSQPDSEPSQLFLKLSDTRHNSLKLCEKHVSQTTSFRIKEATVSKGTKQMRNDIERNETNKSCKKYKRTLPRTNSPKKEGTKEHCAFVIDDTIQIFRKKLKLNVDAGNFN